MGKKFKFVHKGTYGGEKEKVNFMFYVSLPYPSQKYLYIEYIIVENAFPYFTFIIRKSSEEIQESCIKLPPIVLNHADSTEESIVNNIKECFKNMLELELE